MTTETVAYPTEEQGKQATCKDLSLRGWRKQYNEDDPEPAAR